MVHFEWDAAKSLSNQWKHGVDFATAAEVFRDPRRRVLADLKHSAQERRFFCIAKVEGRILTVRFVYRGDVIRILGAGYWRKGREIYEKEKKDRS